MSLWNLIFHIIMGWWSYFDLHNEQISECHKTAEEDKVPLSSVNFEEDTQLWHQIKKGETLIINGKISRRAKTIDRPSHYEDFFRDLTKIQQKLLVRDYQTQLNFVSLVRWNWHQLNMLVAFLVVSRRT